MSQDHRDPYYNQPYHAYGHIGSMSMSDSSNVLDYPSPYMSFSESLLQGSYDNDAVAHAFGLSSSSSISSSHMFYPVKEEEKKLVISPEGGDYRGSGSETMVTTNSSISSSSNEAVADEESNKVDKKDEQVKEIQEEDESPKKQNKSKKKSEKKEKQPRFAFMTKSEVDHLEDGYRWRKYGQKAVKNSPYSRGYYRCTTQKCQVKKRVERSFQDPSIVITTYEGTHNHHVPTNMRGNVGGMFHPYMFTPTHLTGSNFDPETLAQMPHSNYSYGGGGSASGSSMYQQTLTPFQQMQFSHDYGLLQDVVPNSMFLKQEP